MPEIPSRTNWLFLPSQALNDLETIASLGKEKLSRIRDLLDTGEFRSRYSLYVKVADTLAISDEAAANLVAFIKYVKNQREKAGKAASDIPTPFERFITQSLRDPELAPKAEKVRSFFNAHKEEIAKLFAEFPEAEFGAKVQDLQTGPLPHLKSFRAFCDLRPVYNQEATEIVSCFPVITLLLVTHAYESDETKEVLVQLVEANVEEFMEQFKRLEKKL